MPLCFRSLVGTYLSPVTFISKCPLLHPPLQKILMEMLGHIDIYFSTHSHQLTTFFQISLFQMIPVRKLTSKFLQSLIKRIPILTTFCQNLQFLYKFLSKMYPNLYFAPPIIGQYLSYSECLIQGGFLTLNDPLFQRKKNSLKNPLFRLLSEHPHHFKSWVPPSQYILPLGSWLMLPLLPWWCIHV